MSAARVLLADGRVVGFDDLDLGFAAHPDAVIVANPDGTEFDGEAGKHPVMPTRDAITAGYLAGDADLLDAIADAVVDPASLVKRRKGA